MQLQIGKWGNSLAVRLPIALTQKGALKEGDMLDATLEPNGTLNLAPVQVFDKSAFLLALDKLHQTLPQTEAVTRFMY